LGDSDGVLHHSYSTMAVNQYKHVATEPLPTGEVTVRMQFDADKPEPGTGGNVALWANDEKIGEGRMDQPWLYDSPSTPAWTSAATTA
jgi:hypothetical protein